MAEAPAKPKRWRLREAVKKEPILEHGHRLCPGCGEAITLKLVLSCAEMPMVVTNATGCCEVCTGRYPFTSWNVPWIHSAFENAATTAAGIDAMVKARKRRGEIAEDEDVTILAIGGDGATYDIGFQFISGAMERGHRIVYLCLNNEAYMNTGAQRSGATPLGAHTTTSPAGSVIPGKQQSRKDMAAIMAAHNIPYVAQMAPSNWRDMTKKATRAFELGGPCYLDSLCCCPTDWKHLPNEGINITRLAVDSCAWPLFEVDHGVWRITYEPKEKIPIEEYFKTQGRFRHLFKHEDGPKVIRRAQEAVDRQWDRLHKMQEMTAGMEGDDDGDGGG